MPTSPGIEIKVTPEREAPIMPKATMYQGDWRLAVKKVFESVWRVVRNEMPMSTRKYAMMIMDTSSGLIREQTDDFLLLLKIQKAEAMNISWQSEKETELLEVIEQKDLNDLVVYNDDVNTFEHVINTLIKVCKHSIEQAEQCTWIIHYKGKCAVKKGEFETLKPMKDAICEAGIDAKIL